MTGEIRKCEGLDAHCVGKTVSRVEWCLTTGGAAVLAIHFTDWSTLWIDHSGDDMSHLTPSMAYPFPAGTTVTGVRA